MMSAQDKSGKPVGNQWHEPDFHTKTRTGQNSSGMSKSMHDGVEVWCDCCSCEAEPYWVEAMQEAPDEYL